jgi:hypothetical protein
LFAGGYASIVDGGNREISITTQPPGPTASCVRAPAVAWMS